MSLITISIILGCFIFVLYNIITLSFFGVPQSLSMSYYLFKDKLQEEFYCLYLDNKKKYLEKMKLFVDKKNYNL